MPDEIDSIPQLPATASAIAPGTPDRSGLPFDPARHIPKRHPVTGRWMPRGGRKPKSASVSSPSIYSPPAPLAPVTTAAPLTTSSPSPADCPAVPAPLPEPASAPSFADIDRAAATPTPAEMPAMEARAADANAVMVEAAEQQADTLWRALYSVFGAATGAPEETTRTGAAHANNRAALAAWMIESGIKIKGVWGLLIVVVSYFAETGTKPKTRAKFGDWFGGVFKRKPDAAPAVAPAAAPVAQDKPAPVTTSAPLTAQPFFLGQ